MTPPAARSYFSIASLIALQMVGSTPPIPDDTVLKLRLTTSVSSQSAHAGDAVSATLIAPVAIATRILPSGSTLHGQVREVTAHSIAREARLRFDFDRLDIGVVTVPIATRLIDVDNARERIDNRGTILGPSAPEDRTLGRLELLGLAILVPELFVLDVAGSRVREGVRVDISYPTGVDVDVEVTRRTNLPEGSLPAAPAPGTVPAALSERLASLPTRTAAGQPARPADLVNLVFIGSAEALDAAFARAGWTTADMLGARADVKSVLAIAGREGYRHGPLSLETLDGRDPDRVFQKQTNTFAKRHHVRIWQHGTWEDRPLWVAAATHDIGVKFALKERTFTHRVERDVDIEREKIVNDLMFTGTASASYLDRPAVPRTIQNATQDRMDTDGRLALVQLPETR